MPDNGAMINTISVQEAQAAATPLPNRGRDSRLLDGLAIEQLCLHYWNCIDRLAGDEAAALYVEDGRLVLGPMALAGRASIQQFLQTRNAAEVVARRTTRHVATNHRLVSVDGDRAVMTSLVAVYAAVGDLPQPAILPSSFGDFEDELIRDAHGDWRFVSRTGRLVLIGSALPQFLKPAATAPGA